MPKTYKEWTSQNKYHACKIYIWTENQNYN